MSSMNDITLDYVNVPSPGKARMCHLYRWPDFEGYGFNLITKKGHPGHFIGRIDPKSPAEYGGLCVNDLIFEVNGINVEISSHREVADLIKCSKNNEVELLVADDETVLYCEKNGVKIWGGMTGLIYTQTPVPRPTSGIEFVSQNLNGKQIIQNNNTNDYVNHNQEANNKQLNEVPVKPVVIESGVVVEVRQQAKSKSGRPATGNFQRFSTPEPPSPVMLRKGSLYKTQSTEELSQEKMDISRLKMYSKSTENLREEPQSPIGGGFFGDKTIILTPDAPRPRLCHLVKWPNFDRGFGFLLRTYKGTSEKYIVEVDTGSPAEAAGIQEWDCLIEVNGVNVGTENHRQVAARIAGTPNEVKLLVIEEQGLKWYKEQKIVPRGYQYNVIHLNNAINKINEIKEEDKLDVIGNDISMGLNSTGNSPSHSVDDVNYDDKYDEDLNVTITEPNRSRLYYNLINLSVLDMKQILSTKKKYDPRKDSLDFKKRNEIFEQL